MYLCVRGIDFASFYDFAIGLWNCSDSVVFLFSICIVIWTVYGGITSTVDWKWTPSWHEITCNWGLFKSIIYQFLLAWLHVCTFSIHFYSPMFSI